MCWRAIDAAEAAAEEEEEEDEAAGADTGAGGGGGAGTSAAGAAGASGSGAGAREGAADMAEDVRLGLAGGREENPTSAPRLSPRLLRCTLAQRAEAAGSRLPPAICRGR